MHASFEISGPILGRSLQGPRIVPRFGENVDSRLEWINAGLFEPGPKFFGIVTQPKKIVDVDISSSQKNGRSEDSLQLLNKINLIF